MWCFILSLAVILPFKTDGKAYTSGDSASIFSSTSQLQSLLTAEQEILPKLQDLASLLESKSKAIKEFLQIHYTEETFPAQNEEEKFLSHPFNSFGVVSRTSELKEVISNLLIVPELLFDLQNGSSIFPPRSEFGDVCAAIALIQESHDLKTEDLVNGEIRLENGEVFKAVFKPSLEEMASIGVSACNNHWFDTCVEWLQAADEESKTKNVSAQVKEEISHSLVIAKATHDKYLDLKGPVSKTHRCFSLPFDKKLLKKKKFKAISKQGRSAKLQKHRDYHPLFRYQPGLNVNDNNQFICKNGPAWRTADMDKALKSYFLHHGDPFLKIGPFKVEEKSHSPFVVVFKDFMSELEMNHFKRIAESNLKRSAYGGKESEEISGIFRTSKQTWLHDKTFHLPMEFMETTVPRNVENPYKEGYLMASNMLQVPRLPTNISKYMEVVDPIAFKVSLKIQLGTQLYLMGVFSAESFQVANYGIGGQYGPHFDSSGYFTETGINDNDPKIKQGKVYYQATGDRLSTFMAYLSDVQVGGLTSFPLLGLALKPEKGDAVFWLNLKSSGLIEPLTTHSGCPVLVGSKWITNKWVSYLDQYKNYKCSLDSQLDDFDAWRKYRSQNLAKTQ